MKKLIPSVLFLMSLNASAEAWFIENNSNGQIIITNNICHYNGQKFNSLKEGYARSSEGETIQGCWYLANNLIHMTYVDKTTYTYSVNNFKKIGE